MSRNAYADLIDNLPDGAPLPLPPGIAIYITDQSHPSQRERLPADAVPGFVVSVYRLKGKRPEKLLNSMWNRTRGQADRIAQEYAREYATAAACGWR